MKLALHACCGPCLIEPLDALAPDAASLVIVYANPNIHPLGEYERRRDTLASYAEAVGVPLVEVPYDPAAWLTEVGRHGSDRAARCRACYRLRLGLVADWAAREGYDALATTLTVSPYQDAGAIDEEGEGAARAVGIDYVHRDFRDRYPAATSRSRELGMYRQNYCGCLLSEIEAREEREARRAARAAKRQSQPIPQPNSRGTSD
ncbi:MAG TPA: epoxyqueuosine reductase QueH [Coriobacteriia bacterium]|nr:epoxyqueuosine reductase QueH [Coriobacteriia bacterium]